MTGNPTCRLRAMITLAKGNLLEAPAEALVNTVNCVGVMGKGIALQFKQAFPENFKAYKQACNRDEVEPGKMFVFDRGGLDLKPGEPRYLINFPTKRHWKGKSKMEDIESGLTALIEEIARLNIRSVAIPPLGCGNGGLDWADVRPRIEAAFADLPDVRVSLFEPGNAPKAATMPVRTPKPKLTRARALYIQLLDLYRVQGYEFGLLEIQKLAYFLQEGGEELRLKFERGKFGPYADKLNHTLQPLEGHYIRGYGDRAGIKAAILLLPGAVEEARQRLEQEPDAPTLLARLDHVKQLIEGFETPYGMELLATVHWLSRENPEAAEDPRAAVEAVQAWSPRKKRVLKPQHVEVAWHQLSDTGWLSAPAHA